MEIELVKQSEYQYKVYWSNNKYLGTFDSDVDGRFHYLECPTLNGAWDSYQLITIANKLYEVNKPFDDSVKEYFEKEKLKIDGLAVYF